MTVPLEPQDCLGNTNEYNDDVGGTTLDSFYKDLNQGTSLSTAFLYDQVLQDREFSLDMTRYNDLMYKIGIFTKSLQNSTGCLLSELEESISERNQELDAKKNESSKLTATLVKLTSSINSSVSEDKRDAEAVEEEMAGLRSEIFKLQKAEYNKLCSDIDSFIQDSNNTLAELQAKVDNINSLTGKAVETLKSLMSLHDGDQNEDSYSEETQLQMHEALSQLSSFLSENDELNKFHDDVMRFVSDNFDSARGGQYLTEDAMEKSIIRRITTLISPSLKDTIKSIENITQVRDDAVSQFAALESNGFIQVSNEAIISKMKDLSELENSQIGDSDNEEQVRQKFQKYEAEQKLAQLSIEIADQTDKLAQDEASKKSADILKTLLTGIRIDGIDNDKPLIKSYESKFIQGEISELQIFIEENLESLELEEVSEDIFALQVLDALFNESWPLLQDKMKYDAKLANLTIDEYALQDAIKQIQNLYKTKLQSIPNLINEFKDLENYKSDLGHLLEGLVAIAKEYEQILDVVTKRVVEVEEKLVKINTELEVVHNKLFEASNELSLNPKFKSLVATIAPALDIGVDNVVATHCTTHLQIVQDLAGRIQALIVPHSITTSSNRSSMLIDQEIGNIDFKGEGRGSTSRSASVIFHDGAVSDFDQTQVRLDLTSEDEESAQENFSSRQGRSFDQELAELGIPSTLYSPISNVVFSSGEVTKPQAATVLRSLAAALKDTSLSMSDVITLEDQNIFEEGLTNIIFHSDTKHSGPAKSEMSYGALLDDDGVGDDTSFYESEVMEVSSIVATSTPAKSQVKIAEGDSLDSSTPVKTHKRSLTMSGTAFDSMLQGLGKIETRDAQVVATRVDNLAHHSVVTASVDSTTASGFTRRDADVASSAVTFSPASATSAPTIVPAPVVAAPVVAAPVVAAPVVAAPVVAAPVVAAPVVAAPAVAAPVVAAPVVAAPVVVAPAVGLVARVDPLAAEVEVMAPVASHASISSEVVQLLVSMGLMPAPNGDDDSLELVVGRAKANETPAPGKLSSKPLNDSAIDLTSDFIEVGYKRYDSFSDDGVDSAFASKRPSGISDYETDAASLNRALDNMSPDDFTAVVQKAQYVGTRSELPFRDIDTGRIVIADHDNVVINAESPSNARSKGYDKVNELLAAFRRHWVNTYVPEVPAS